MQALLSVMLLGIFSCLSAHAAEGVARVLMKRGNVQAITTENKIVQLNKGDWVQEGSAIQTQAGSFAKLVYIDKSIMNVGPNSSLVIKKFKTGEAGIISILKGQIKAKVTPSTGGLNKNKSKLFIKSRTAVMGIRGTVFEVVHDPSNHSTNLTTLSGAVKFVKLNDSISGQKLNSSLLDRLLNSDQAVWVRDGQYSFAMPGQSRALAPQRLPSSVLNSLKGTDHRPEDVFENDKVLAVALSGKDINKGLAELSAAGHLSQDAANKAIKDDLYGPSEIKASFANLDKPDKEQFHQLQEEAKISGTENSLPIQGLTGEHGEDAAQYSVSEIENDPVFDVDESTGSEELDRRIEKALTKAESLGLYDEKGEVKKDLPDYKKKFADKISKLVKKARKGKIAQEKTQRNASKKELYKGAVKEALAKMRKVARDKSVGSKLLKEKVGVRQLVKAKNSKYKTTNTTIKGERKALVVKQLRPKITKNIINNIPDSKVSDNGARDYNYGAGNTHISNNFDQVVKRNLGGVSTGGTAPLAVDKGSSKGTIMDEIPKVAEGPTTANVQEHTACASDERNSSCYDLGGGSHARSEPVERKEEKCRRFDLFCHGKKALKSIGNGIRKMTDSIFKRNHRHHDRHKKEKISQAVNTAVDLKQITAIKAERDTLIKKCVEKEKESYDLPKSPKITDFMKMNAELSKKCTKLVDAEIQSKIQKVVQRDNVVKRSPASNH